MQVTVQPEPNTVPVANAGLDQTYTVPHDFYPSDETDLVRVTLNGSLTADDDGDRMRHHWSCGAVSSASTASVPSYATVISTPQHDQFWLIAGCRWAYLLLNN